MATITGQRASSPLPARDTPRIEDRRSGTCQAISRAAAAVAAWGSVVPALAGTPHVRISRDGGRTYPARHARPLPAEPPGQPCTIPASIRPRAPGGCWSLTLTCPVLASQLMVLLSMTIVSVAPSRWPRRPWRLPSSSPGAAARSSPTLRRPAAANLRRVRRGAALARAARPLQGDGAAVPVDRHGADGHLGGQISPPGSRHKSGGWRLLSTPVDLALAALEHPSGPEVWNGLQTEFAAELQQIGTGSAAEPVPELDDTGRPVGAAHRRPREPRR